MKHAALALGLAACGRIDFDPVPVHLERDCALWLKMDEERWTGAAGEVIDSCGDPNSGTALGGATTVDDPVRGRVGSIPDGGCIAIAYSPELEAAASVSMTAWLDVSLAGTSGVVCKRDTDPSGPAAHTSYTLLTSGGAIAVDLDFESEVSDIALPLGRWVQLTVVVDADAARTRIYLDGRIAGTLPQTMLPDSVDGSALHVGCLWNPQPVGESLRGLIDDVAVWTRALDAFEVEAWYEQTKR